MLTANYTVFRSNLKKYLNLAALEGEEIVIPRGRDRDVVLISLERYNELIRNEAASQEPVPEDPSGSGDRARFLAYARAVLEAVEAEGTGKN